MSEQNEQLRACHFCGTDVNADDQDHKADCYFTVQREGGNDRAAWNRRAQPAPTVQAGPTSLLNAEQLAALHRFNETCEDGEGYDVPKAMMKSLAEIGVVTWKGFSRYQITDFGMLILFGAAPAHASSDGRDAILEEALNNLIEVAERCDSWESFPENELDKARAALAGTGVKGVETARVKTEPHFLADSGMKGGES